MEWSEKIKEDAEFLRLGCLAGYIGYAQVIKWADNIIAQSAQPSYSIIEIATAKGRDDLLAKLEQLEGEYDQNRVLKRFFWLLYQRLSEDKNRAQEITNRLYEFMLQYQDELSQ
jgi:hypothetical protein